MIHFIKNNKIRILSIVLLILFIIFSTVIPVQTAFATPAVLPLLPDVVAIIGTILGMGGVSFNSTADLYVGATGFYERMAQDATFEFFLTQLTGGSIATNGKVDLRELGTALTGGWSYFWEQADSYFGVTSGVPASVSSALFDPNMCIEFSSADFNYNAYSESSLTGLTQVDLINSGETLSIVYNDSLGSYVGELLSVPFGAGDVFRLGYSSKDGHEYKFYGTLDNWNTLFPCSKELTSYMLFNNQILAGRIKIALSLEYGEGTDFSIYLRYNSNVGTLAPCQKIFDSAVVEGQDFFDGFGDLLAKLRGDDVIIPGYDEAAGTYAGQDVFGAVDDVSDTDEDLLIDIGYLTGALTDGIGIDQVIDLPIDDVIPKSVTDVLEKNPPDKPVDPDNPDDPNKPTKPDGTKVPPGWLLPSLSNKFPFCVPFDLIACISALNAEPKPIVFDFPLVVENIGLNYTFHIDLSDFEPVSEICRIFFTLEFIIFLILITRKIIGA